MGNIKNIILEEIQNLNEAYDDLAMSLWGLIKYNGGYFKSEKQKDFFHNKLKKQNKDAEKHGFSGRDGLVTSGEVYGNPFTHTFYFDDKGITKVVKNTKKGGDKIAWERSEENIKKSQTNKIHKDFANAVKKYTQELNDKYENIKNEKLRELEEKYPEYKTLLIDFYNSSINRSTEDLKNKLNDIENKISGTEEKSKGILELILAVGNFVLNSRNEKLIPSDGGEQFSYNIIFNKLFTKYNTPEKKQEFINMVNKNN